MTRSEKTELLRQRITVFPVIKSLCCFVANKERHVLGKKMMSSSSLVPVRFTSLDQYPGLVGLNVLVAKFRHVQHIF